MLRMIMSRGRKMMMLRMMMRRPIPRPRPTVCASLGSPNALGQNTRSILCEKLQEKYRTPDGPQTATHTCGSLRSQHAHGHVTRAILRGILQEKCRAPDGSRDRDPHFARACAIEMHLGMSLIIRKFTRKCRSPE